MFQPRTLPLNVVAVMKPDHWVVRAMSPFEPGESLVRKLLPYVGVMDHDLVWTGYRYEGYPHYVVNGPRKEGLWMLWPSGVYRFPILKTYDQSFGSWGPHEGDVILGEGAKIGN